MSANFKQLFYWYNLYIPVLYNEKNIQLQTLFPLNIQVHATIKCKQEKK
jgi:hypothetical protein